MSRHRGGLAIIAISILLLTVAATGGGDPEVGQDRVLEEITAEPHPGPNGAYASVDNESGELVIDLTADNDAIDGDGVNPEAFTVVHDVFTLAYTGEEFAHVWLEHDADAVEFYANGDKTDSIEGERNNVSLAPNESVAVGFTADSSDHEPTESLIESIEIHAKLPDPDEREAPSDPVDPPRSGISPTPCPTPTVNVDAPKKTTRAVSITDADPCQTATIDLLEYGVGPGVTLEELEASVATDEDVDLAVGPDEERKTTPFDEPGLARIGDVAVDGPDDAVEEVTYRYALEEKWLEREGIDPETVAVYGYDGDDWSELETERLEAKDGTVASVATDDGFSRYVVAADAPTLEGERTDDADDSSKAGTDDETAIAEVDEPAASEPEDEDGDRSDPAGSMVVAGLLAVALVAIALGALAYRRSSS